MNMNMMSNMNNMSAANIRQTVKLQGAVSAGANSRAQSAVNTAQSSNYNPQMMGFMGNNMINPQMQMRQTLGASASVALPSAQDGSTNMSAQGRNGQIPRSINADAPPLVTGFRDAPKSADGKFRN